MGTVRRNTLVKQNDRIHEHTLFSVMGQKLTGHATALIIADLEADAEYYALNELGFVASSDTTLVSDTVYLESEYQGMNCRSEFKDVAATQLQRIHTPESYAGDSQPTCDGERGRSDARYQYQPEVHSPLRAFCRGPRLLSVAAAYANFSIPPEITAPRFASNRRGKSIKTLFHPQKRGQFEAESALGDGQSRTGGIPPDDIVRSGTARNFDVRNRSRIRL